MRSRTILRGAGLAASAAVLLAAAGGAVVAADTRPPEPPEAVAPPEIDVPAGPVTQVCPGPALLTAGEGTDIDPEVDPEDTDPQTRTRLVTLPRESTAAAEAGYAVAGGEEADALPAEGELRLLTLDDPEDGGLFTAAPSGEVAALLAGVTATRTDAGDLRGLAAGPCVQPASTTWLIGGGTELGQSARLVLTNTGRTPATATAAVWTSLGPVDAPSLTEVVIAPGEQEAILLEAALGAGDPSLALRVDSPGGQVAAQLQDLQREGVVAAGVDHVPPAASPRLELHIPGVVIAEDGGDAVAQEAGEDPALPRLRLVNPDDEEEATAAVRLLGAEGPVALPGAEEVVLDPGSVMDLSLGGVEPGAYAIEVNSDQPVTGGVMLPRVGQAGELDPSTPPVDRGWTAAAVPVETGILQTSPLAAQTTVVLSNPGEEDAEAELLPFLETGAPDELESVTVPAGASVSLDATELAEEGPALRLDADTPLVAATVVTVEAADGELISILPLTPDPSEERSVPVDVSG